MLYLISHASKNYRVMLWSYLRFDFINPFWLSFLKILTSSITSPYCLYQDANCFHNLNVYFIQEERGGSEAAQGIASNFGWPSTLRFIVCLMLNGFVLYQYKSLYCRYCTLKILSHLLTSPVKESYH